MGAAHEAELGFCVGVFPHQGVVLLHPAQLGVVDDVLLRAGDDEVFALLFCLGGEAVDVIKAHRAVGGGGRAEVLQIGAGGIVQLAAQPAVQPHHIGHVLHHLHADGGAQQLGLGLFGGFHLHHPGGLAALVGEQAEIRHEAGDGAHQVHNAGVAVAPGAQHGVGVDHRRALGPAEHLALGGAVALFIQVAGAAEGVLVLQAQGLQLALVEVLLAVHELLKDQVLQEVRGHTRVQGPGVRRELLAGHRPRGDELVHQVVDRAQGLEAEGGDQMVVTAGDGHHLLGAENFAVHDQGLHHLGHGRALFAVQKGLLFLCQFHFVSSLTASWPHPTPAR